MPAIILGIGSAIASGAGAIFGGAAQSAAIERQNQQAYRNWIQANTQKTFNNAREQFQAAYQFAQQLKRNEAIARSAYEYQFDNRRALEATVNFQQTELANDLRSQKASLLNAITNKGISSSSGMYGSLATMQAVNGLNNAMQLERNRLAQAKNIDIQTKNMLTQQTENIFMPNIQLYDEEPIYGDASAAATGGLVSGLLQIGSGVAAGLTSFGTGGPGLTGTTTHNYGGTGNSTSSGISGGGGYIPTSNSAPLGIGPH